MVRAQADGATAREAIDRLQAWRDTGHRVQGRRLGVCRLRRGWGGIRAQCLGRRRWK
jgi:hypothetical protein